MADKKIPRIGPRPPTWDEFFVEEFGETIEEARARLDADELREMTKRAMKIVKGGKPPKP